MRGIHRFPVNSPAQRPVTRNFDVFFDSWSNKRLVKQWWSWWFETPSSPLWRHCNAIHCVWCVPGITGPPRWVMDKNYKKISKLRKTMFGPLILLRVYIKCVVVINPWSTTVCGNRSCDILTHAHTHAHTYMSSSYLSMYITNILSSSIHPSNFGINLLPMIIMNKPFEIDVIADYHWKKHCLPVGFALIKPEFVTEIYDPLYLIAFNHHQAFNIDHGLFIASSDCWVYWTHWSLA